MIYKVLLDSKNDVDFSIASDFFNWKSNLDDNEKDIDIDEDQEKTSGDDFEKQNENDDKTIVPIKISEINSNGLIGIKMSSKVTDKEDIVKLKYPYQGKLELAYVQDTGNPFSRYKKEDFDLSDEVFNFKRTGNITIFKQQNNIIEFEIGSENFEFSFSGFEKLGEEDIKYRLKINEKTT